MSSKKVINLFLQHNRGVFNMPLWIFFMSWTGIIILVNVNFTAFLAIDLFYFFNKSYDHNLALTFLQFWQWFDFDQQ